MYRHASRNPYFISMKYVPLLAIFLILTFLAGCAAINPKEDIPPSAYAPYIPSNLNDYQKELIKEDNKKSIDEDFEKSYRLTDLIDLAQRVNPETRIAWEKTKQAGIAVGLHEAAYFPIIKLLANTGKTSLDIKVKDAPSPLEEPRIDTEMAGAGLFLKWLLFDFGAREADIRAAQHQLVASTMSFNRTHQKIIKEVTQSYYELCAERGKLAVAKANLASAEAIENAANERFNQGTATSPDQLLAKARAAQASYDLIQTQANDEIALANLCEVIGLPPDTKLKVADMEDAPLPENLDDEVDNYTSFALSNRPDLIAAMAQLKAKNAELFKAHADLLPKIGVTATADHGYATATAYPLPVNNADLTIDNYAVFLQAEWTIFDGFSNINKIRLAETEKKIAEEELEHTQTKIEGDVFKAYIKLKTSLRKVEVSKALVEASQKSYESAMESYKQGLQSVLDTLAVQRDLRTAQEINISTKAEVFTNWQNLAFAMGKDK
jgi:outer membrane protein TolC